MVRSSFTLGPTFILENCEISNFGSFIFLFVSSFEFVLELFITYYFFKNSFYLHLRLNHLDLLLLVGLIFLCYVNSEHLSKL